jgi:hypothetical protein
MKGVMAMRIHHLLIGVTLVPLAMNCNISFLDTHGAVPAESGIPCNNDANCDDGNPCTVETCPDETKVCAFASVSDGSASAAAQTAADCKTVQCVSGNPFEEEDAQDVLNDNESCTDDVCSAGTPMNTPRADGDTCMIGQMPGTCQSGVCTP